MRISVFYVRTNKWRPQAQRDVAKWLRDMLILLPVHYNNELFTIREKGKEHPYENCLHIFSISYPHKYLFSLSLSLSFAAAAACDYVVVAFHG